MKLLPRVPVWLILLPLVALALSSWFGSAAEQSFSSSRTAYAAAAAPSGKSTATPTPSEQSAQSCASTSARDGKEQGWRGAEQHGFGFRAWWGFRNTAIQACASRSSRDWHFGRGGPFHHHADFPFFGKRP